MDILVQSGMTVKTDRTVRAAEGTVYSISSRPIGDQKPFQFDTVTKWQEQSDQPRPCHLLYPNTSPYSLYLCFTQLSTTSTIAYEACLLFYA